MKGYRISVLLVAFLALLFVSACAKPPEAEKAAAKAAMDAAVSAGADKYAKSQFDEASKVWQDAEGHLTAKQYDDAKKGYEAAKAAFEQAGAAVAAGKKAMADEATAAAGAAEEAWKAVDANVKKVAARLAADLKTAWAEDAKKVEDGLKALRDQIGTDPLGAKAKVGEIKALIAKWEGTLKDLPAAPAAKVPAKK